MRPVGNTSPQSTLSLAPIGSDLNLGATLKSWPGRDAVARHVCVAPCAEYCRHYYDRRHAEIYSERLRGYMRLNTIELRQRPNLSAVPPTLRRCEPHLVYG